MEICHGFWDCLPLDREQSKAWWPPWGSVTPMVSPCLSSQWYYCYWMLKQLSQMSKLVIHLIAWWSFQTYWLLLLVIDSCALFPFLDCNRAELLNEMENGNKWSLLQFKPVLLPYVHLHLLFTRSTIMIFIVVPSKQNTIREKINYAMKQSWCLQEILFCWGKAKWSCAWVALMHLCIDCSKWTILCHYALGNFLELSSFIILCL